MAHRTDTAPLLAASQRWACASRPCCVTCWSAVCRYGRLAAELGEHPYRTSAKVKAALALLGEHLADVTAERRAAG